MLAFALMCSGRATAQHTLTLTGGTGASYARFYPAEETKWMWGCENFGIAWRYYSEKPRFVGAVGGIYAVGLIYDNKKCLLRIP